MFTDFFITYIYRTCLCFICKALNLECGTKCRDLWCQKQSRIRVLQMHRTVYRTLRNTLKPGLFLIFPLDDSGSNKSASWRSFGPGGRKWWGKLQSGMCCLPSGKVMLTLKERKAQLSYAHLDIHFPCHAPRMWDPNPWAPCRLLLLLV